MKTLTRAVPLLLVMLLCVPLAVSQPKGTGAIKVSGSVYFGALLRDAPGTSAPVVVLRKSGGHLIHRFHPMQKDSTCWTQPQGCPFVLNFPNLANGSYTVSVEVQDETFMKSSGMEGCCRIVGFYTDPAPPAEYAKHVTDYKKAKVLVIDAKHQSYDVKLNIPKF